MRRVCVVVKSRASYGRVRSVMKEIDAHPDLELTFVLGASAVLRRFGNLEDVVRGDGFEPDAVIHSIVEGTTPATMAASTGLGMLQLTTLLEQLKPDVVVTVADRFETLATAAAAAYMNIPVAHVQGGEVTGSIDESVRHAVSKLSHLHFPATERAGEFLRRMGEREDTIHVVGCPSLDALLDLDIELTQEEFDAFGGTGAELDVTAPYVLVAQHPVTTEFGSGLEQIEQTLAAVDALDVQAIWFWPNVDAGSDEVSKGLRLHREREGDRRIHFFRNLRIEDYARVMANAVCVVGNTSSALREGSFLGVPAVNIGTRQRGRERADNVVDVGHDAGEIEQAILVQIQHGPYERNSLYGDGLAGARIADVLATAPLVVEKMLSYAFEELLPHDQPGGVVAPRVG